MYKVGRSVMMLLLCVFIAACSEQKTGPVEVKWDRDAGQRCMMVLSDRFHAAQIRHNFGDDSELFKFDDIGCAILWLEDKDWKDNDRTEFWVNDHRNGQWIDAYSAWYVDGHSTPMEYGLGAQIENTEGAFDFIQARVRIVEHEKRYNRHGSPLEMQGRERRLQGNHSQMNHDNKQHGEMVPSSAFRVN